jgi:hypothetical protein
MEAPWPPDHMDLHQARQEYQRMRAIERPSTADLRREAALARRIETLARSEFRAAMDVAGERYELAVAGVGR